MPTATTTTLDIEVKAGALDPIRTFVIRLRSTLMGYEARVAARLNTGGRLPLGLSMPPTQTVRAHEFYPKRDYYATLLLTDVMAELHGWRFQEVAADAAVKHAIVQVDATGFDMRQARADNFSRWDPVAVADKLSAVPGTTILLSRSDRDPQA